MGCQVLIGTKLTILPSLYFIQPFLSHFIFITLIRMFHLKIEANRYLRIGYLKFDGKLSQKHKEGVLKEFSENISKLVLLIFHGSRDLSRLEAAATPISIPFFFLRILPSSHCYVSLRELVKDPSKSGSLDGFENCRGRRERERVREGASSQRLKP